MEPVLTARQLTKVYRVYKNPSHRIKEILLRRPFHEPFVALDHVSLEVMPGTAIGVIGENGAGKSTLLSILAGVLRPTGGEVKSTGRIASILDLGGGFHGEFTGRQNIQMSAAMRGMTRKEIEQSLDRIVDFSELHHFIDKPIKTYSSGMHIRLAFSVAINVNPDILVIDEVLAVGDSYFQHKCLDNLRTFLNSGRAIVFCSHSMYSVVQFCKNAIWLKEGRVRSEGPAQDVVAAYENYTRQKELRKKAAPFEAKSVEKAEAIEELPPHAWIESCSINGIDREPLVCRFSEPFTASAVFRTSKPEWKYHAGIVIDRNDHLNCYASSTLTDGLPPFEGRSLFQADFLVPSLPFLRGNYFLKFFLLDETGLHVLDQKIVAFSVVSDGHPWGVCFVPHEWRVT